MNMMLKKTNYQSISLAFGQMIHVQISYCWLFTTYTKLLMLYPTLETCGACVFRYIYICTFRFCFLTKPGTHMMANIQTQGTWGSRFSVKSDWKFLNCLEEYRFQRVLLNGQMSEWLPPVKAGSVPQHKVPSLVCFFSKFTLMIYLMHDLVSTIKLFADDTSQFSVVHDQRHISRLFWSRVYQFGRPNSGTQKRFFNFLFEDFF